MKILFVSNNHFTVPEKISSWIVCRDFLSSISRFPVDVHGLLSIEGKMGLEFAPNLMVDNLQLSKGLRLPGMINDMNLTYFPRLVKRWKELNKENFSLIHHFLFSIKGTNSFDALAALGITCGKPLIVGPAELPHQFGWEDYKLYSGRRRFLTKSEYSFFMTLPAITSKFLRRGFLKTLERCEKLVLAKSSATKIYEPFVSPKKMIVIPHGVKLQNFRDLHSPTEHKILIIGNLIERKLIGTALVALRRVLDDFPDARLEIVGEGPEMAHLMRVTKQLSLSQSVRFCGRISYEKLTQKLCTCGVLCHTSASEAVSHVVDEAMASGRPVICTDIPANADTIEHGKSGYLFPPGNSQALSDYIGKIFGDPNLAQTFGAHAYEQSKLKEWSKVAEKYYRLYQSAI